MCVLSTCSTRTSRRNKSESTKSDVKKGASSTSRWNELLTNSSPPPVSCHAIHHSTCSEPCSTTTSKSNISFKRPASIVHTFALYFGDWIGSSWACSLYERAFVGRQTDGYASWCWQKNQNERKKTLQE